ncbi:MAG: Crp/Fnr family transcriptional regulator [Caulobacterales bacterium]
MEPQTIRSVLGRNPWFAGLGGDLQDDIVRLGRERRVRDAVIFAVGDEPNGLFAVLAGEVRSSHSASDGRLGLLMVARAGSWFGETSMFDGRLRYSEALAVGRVELLCLSPRAFREIIDESAERYGAFVRLLCDHHRLAMDHIASLGALPVRARVAQRLLFFARSGRTPDRSDNVVTLSQEQLASTVGVSRQTLNGVLRRLEEADVLSLGYGRITLRNRAELERLVETAAAV